MPMNPNMKSAKLVWAFEQMGFSDVQTVIASGNVIFESRSKNEAALEKKIEAALPKLLKFKSTTIVRSRADLEKLVKKDPFKGVKDERPNYLLVTFFQDRKPELCSVITLTEGKTPDFMSKVEKAHGKAITSRTWKTVHRILKKMA